MADEQAITFQGWPEDRKERASESRERFRHNLARIMSERGITQAGLARTMDVSRVAVHAWIWGTCFPETSRLMKLAQALDVQVGALLDGEDGMKPETTSEESMLLEAFRKLPSTARSSLLAEVYAMTGRVTPRPGHMVQAERVD